MYCWLECPACHQPTQKARIQREGSEIAVYLLDGAECGHSTTEEQDDDLDTAAYRLFVQSESEQS